MNFLILKDQNGGTVHLTTDSPSSSHGKPVLQITADDIYGDFGPADIIGHPEELLTGAAIVFAWGIQLERTPEEVEAAKRFLAQWPEGPQLDM